MAMLTDLASVCRSTGKPVVELSGWKTRRRSSGEYQPGYPRYTMWHHTASPSSWDGSKDAVFCAVQATYAPLANLYISRNGTIYVLAAGPTNTNGAGGPLNGCPANGMNARAIGIEMGNNGVGEPWPKALQDTAVALGQVLMTRYGITAANNLAHFEWAPTRKIDPYGPCRWNGNRNTFWDMGQFRSTLGATTPPPPPPPEDDDDMKLYVAREKNGTIWVGNGVERTGVHNMDELNFRIFCSNLGCGPTLVALYGNGFQVTDAAQINKMSYTPQQLDAIGTAR